MLAAYLRDVNEDGQHDWVVESGKNLTEDQFIGIPEGAYNAMIKREEYARKKVADKNSYFWDHLIEKFAKNLVSGKLAPIPERLGAFDGRHGGAEKALRYMALEDRLERRNNSEAFLTAFDKLEEGKGNRFFRAMLSFSEEKKTGFCVLLLKRDAVPDHVSFNEYREFRCRMLGAYAEGIAERNRHLDRVIGIATEGERGGPRTEDLIYLEPPEWTDEAIELQRATEAGFEIFQEKMNLVRFGSDEYPEAISVGPNSYRPIPYNFIEPKPVSSESKKPMNRRQRRAEAARKRKTR